MNDSLPMGIAEVKTDPFEMTITISPEYEHVAAEEPLLREVTAYAVERGYSRCAGANRNGSGKGVKHFFFSIPEYYDNDDMLIADLEIKAKVERLKEEGLT